MVTNEIILSDEVADYPNHMLLSDFGGIFGFFVGITMLTFVSCLKKIYWYTIRVSQIWTRFILNGSKIVLSI